ncbi:MAG: hypothetical protein GX165_04100 [Firmicutes bacterium]|nr:hypothetical protein [Bacillota bacterium]
MRRKGVDGIISGMAQYDDNLVMDLSKRNYPLTLMVRDLPVAQVNRALIDDRAGALSPLNTS